MNAWAYLALHNVASIAGGVYLVSHDCPWWGLLCFVLVASTTVSTKVERDAS